MTGKRLGSSLDQGNEYDSKARQRSPATDHVGRTPAPDTSSPASRLGGAAEEGAREAAAGAAGEGAAGPGATEAIESRLSDEAAHARAVLAHAHIPSSSVLTAPSSIGKMSPGVQEVSCGSPVSPLTARDADHAGPCV